MNRKIFYILLIGILAIASSISINSESVVYADTPATITISSNVDNAKPGDLVEITVFIKNHGQYNLSNVLLHIGIPNGLTFVDLQTNHNNVQFDPATGMLNFNNLRTDANGSNQEVAGTKMVILIFKVNDDYNGTLSITAEFENLTAWGTDGDSLLSYVNPADSLNITVNNQNTNESGNESNNTTNDNNVNNTENNNNTDNNNNTENNDNETVTNINETIIEEKDDAVVQAEISKDKDKNDTKKNDTIKKPSKNPFANPKPGSGSIPSTNKKSSNPTISTSNSTGSYNSFDSLDSSEEEAPSEAKASELNTNNSSSGDSGKNSLLSGLSDPIVAILTSASLLGLGIIGYFYGIRP